MFFIFKSIKRFPFDTKTPIGFSVAIFMDYILYVGIMITVECLMIFGIGTCSMLFPLTNDMKCDLKSCGVKSKCKKNRSKIVKQFAQFIRFHSKLIQLSHMKCAITNVYEKPDIILFLFRLIHDFSELTKVVFILLFLWSSAAICCQMLLLNMKMVKYFEIILN